MAQFFFFWRGETIMKNRKVYILNLFLRTKTGASNKASLLGKYRKQLYIFAIKYVCVCSKNFTITIKQTHNKNSNTAIKAKTVKCLDTKHFRKFVRLVRAAHVVYTCPRWWSAVFPAKLLSVEPGRYPLVLTLLCVCFFTAKMFVSQFSCSE